MCCIFYFFTLCIVFTLWFMYCELRVMHIIFHSFVFCSLSLLLFHVSFHIISHCFNYMSYVIVLYFVYSISLFYHFLYNSTLYIIVLYYMILLHLFFVIFVYCFILYF